jgi:hypothetical protein
MILNISGIKINNLENSSVVRSYDENKKDRTSL